MSEGEKRIPIKETAYKNPKALPQDNRKQICLAVTFGMLQGKADTPPFPSFLRYLLPPSVFLLLLPFSLQYAFIKHLL